MAATVGLHARAAEVVVDGHLEIVGVLMSSFKSVCAEKRAQLWASTHIREAGFGGAVSGCSFTYGLLASLPAVRSCHTCQPTRILGLMDFTSP